MENENTNDWLGFKVMAHCRPNKAHREHNRRDPKIVSKEKHIDSSRIHETIFDLGTIEEVYHKVFDEAVAEYNATHRADRRIENYLELIRNDKRRGRHLNSKADGSRKESYELILQFGNRENRPDDEIAIKILKEFCEFIPKKYPCIFPYGIYLHADEFSIDSETGEKVYSPAHIHFDFLFLAEKDKGVKTGLSLQSSLSGGLRQMGFVTGNGHTAQQLWEEDLRATLQDFAEKRGLKIDRTPGERHSHKEKPLFQQMMENKRKEKRLLEQEVQIENTQKELSQNIENYNHAALEINADIKNVHQEKIELIRKERELKRQQYELQQREVNAKMKENINEFQKQTNESKSIELSNRERAIEIAETPIKQKQKELAEEQSKLEETAKTVDAKIEQLQILKKENEQTKKSLEVKENELERDKYDFESLTLKIQGYKEIQNEVETNNLSIDSEINDFKNDRSNDFSTRLNKFVRNVKKIVTAVTTELSWYKAAFKNFWKKCSQDFRKLADLMDRNKCETFSDFNRMYYNGQLDYQLEERQKRRKDNSMDFER